MSTCHTLDKSLYGSRRTMRHYLPPQQLSLGLDTKQQPVFFELIYVRKLYIFLFTLLLQIYCH